VKFAQTPLFEKCYAHLSGAAFNQDFVNSHGCDYEPKDGS